jgi:hypothetical protein
MNVDQLNQPIEFTDNKKCYSCGKVFRTPANLLTHKNRKTPCIINEVPPDQINNPNKCIFCNKIFIQKQSLTRHFKTCKIKNRKIDAVVDKINYDQEIRILKEQRDQDNKTRGEQIQQMKAEIEELKRLLKLSQKHLGYLYFISEEQFNNKVKIGISKNPEKRLKQLQTGNPNKLVIIHTIQSPDYKLLERTLHDICGDLRLVGEWFELSESDLNKLIDS